MLLQGGEYRSFIYLHPMHIIWRCFGSQMWLVLKNNGHKRPANETTRVLHSGSFICKLTYPVTLRYRQTPPLGCGVIGAIVEVCGCWRVIVYYLLLNLKSTMFLEHVQTLLETRHAPPGVDGDCLHSSLFSTLCLECIDSIAYLVEVNGSFFTLVCNAVIVFCN